jgi:hypothetical protein
MDQIPHARRTSAFMNASISRAFDCEAIPKRAADAIPADWNMARRLTGGSIGEGDATADGNESAFLGSGSCRPEQ